MHTSIKFVCYTSSSFEVGEPRNFKSFLGFFIRKTGAPTRVRKEMEIAG